MKNFRKYLLLILSMLCAICFCTACFSSVTLSGIQLEALPALDPVYGVNPGEGILIDGEANEAVWREKNYVQNEEKERNVSYYVTTHLSEKGVYIFAYSSDAWVCYANRNNYKRNTHFYFVLTAKEGQGTFNSGVCREMKIDTSAYTMPSNFRYTAFSTVNGEVNSGKSQGMQVEVFVSWEQLGLGTSETKPEEVKLHSAYFSVTGLNKDGKYVSNLFSSNAPSTHHRYNVNGYIETGDLENGLGSSAYGTVKSGGFEKTENGMESVGGGSQTAFFDMYSDSFVISAKVRSNGGVYNASTIGKAGFILSQSSGYYSAIMLDLRAPIEGKTVNTNVDEDGTILNDRLISLCNYPNGSQLRTSEIYEGIDGEYEYVDLTLIKDKSTCYYIVNGELAKIEYLDWMQGAVRAGIYAMNADCVFSDYSYIDCSKDETALDRVINTYACRISYENNDPKVVFQTETTAVKKGETGKVDFYVASGYTVEKIYNNNIDVTDYFTRNQSGATLSLKNVSEDAYLEADVKEIEDYVTVSGKATLPNGAKAPFTDVYVIGEKPFTSYYLRTDANGEYTAKVAKDNAYQIRIGYNGYRTTTVDVIVANTDVRLNLGLENYVVGGSANGRVSNTAAWDLSQESENVVTLDLLDRTSGGAIYFTDVYSNAVVIEVTITNLTNQEISEPYYKTGSNLNGEYESDPGAGIRVTSNKGTSFYMLYKEGYRNRWNNGSYNDMHLNTNCATKSIFKTGEAIKMKLARFGEQFYMYIDGNLVYAEKNPFIGNDNAVYGFFYDSSAILKLQFSDYSILSGQQAEDEIQNTLLAKFNYDQTIVQVDGLKNGYGLYNTEPVISLKNIPDGKARLVAVGGVKYYLTSKNNSITYAISDYNPAGMPDVTIECGNLIDARLVSGKINVQANMFAYSEDGVYTYFQTDKNGNYQIYLPDGTYHIIAQAKGYMGDYKTVSVNGSAINGLNITLKEELLGNNVIINNESNGSQVEVLSRPLGYPISFNEKELRHSVHANENGNGGGIYFKDLVSKDVMISFSFVYNSGSENDPGIGIWVTNAREPALNGQSIRVLFKNQAMDVLWRKQTGNEIGVDRGWIGKAIYQNGATASYDVRTQGVEYDAIFVRLDNVYYMYIKQSSETEYKLACKFESDIVPDLAAYGFSVTAGSSSNIEFFNYSYQTDKAEIQNALNELSGN
ncbi:MAG: hypothetical protein IJW58_01995 [Clostridia bacterium]|nr:hypothetical protein [Clostridia bacterium]